MATLYSIIAGAKLSGIPGGYRAIYLYARNLTKPQRRALHCWFNPRTGEYEVPSETSFFRALKLVPVEQVQAAVDAWLDMKLGPALPGGQVALDGKTLNPSGVHWVSAIQVPSQRCLGVAAVADKTNEITAVRQLIHRTDLAGCLVEMDALNTRDETVQKLLYAPAGAQLDPAVPAALVRALNQVAKGPGLYDPVRFPDPILSDQTKAFRVENGTHQRPDCSALEDRLRIHDPNAVEILGFFHRVSISLFVAWAQQQPSVRDRTYPTWQADHQANRWRMIHQVTRAPA